MPLMLAAGGSDLIGAMMRVHDADVNRRNLNDQTKRPPGATRWQP
jgi:hypothetical protein